VNHCAVCNRGYKYLELFDGLCFSCQMDAAKEKLKGRVLPVQPDIDPRWADGCKTTSDLARAALQRPERFPGEHDVAWAWLRDYPEDLEAQR
jgi:hypothetical protein